MTTLDHFYGLTEEEGSRLEDLGDGRPARLATIEQVGDRLDAPTDVLNRYLRARKDDEEDAHLLARRRLWMRLHLATKVEES